MCHHLSLVADIDKQRDRTQDIYALLELDNPNVKALQNT
jgi:hypothetical protein